jgi:hypothetical protein
MSGVQQLRVVRVPTAGECATGAAPNEALSTLGERGWGAVSDEGAFGVLSVSKPEFTVKHVIKQAM